MRNVLLTDVQANGGPPVNVLVYTSLDAATLATAWRRTPSIQFADCYEVAENEIEYHHVDERCWLDAQEEERARELATA